MIDLFCIDGIDPEGAIRTLKHCVKVMPDKFFSRTALCGPAPAARMFQFEFIQATVNSGNTSLPAGARPESMMHPYNSFVIRTLPNYVQSSHFLIIHRDGYIIHPNLWTDDFLRCDYLGAPWPHHQGRVGNGGFSLRSKRLADWASRLKSFNPYIPEDGWLCHPPIRGIAEDTGFAWAPQSLAHHFSTEYSGDIEKSFGFHGIGRGLEGVHRRYL